MTNLLVDAIATDRCRAVVELHAKFAEPVHSDLRMLLDVVSRPCACIKYLVANVFYKVEQSHVYLPVEDSAALILPAPELPAL